MKEANSSIIFKRYGEKSEKRRNEIERTVKRVSTGHSPTKKKHNTLISIWKL